MKILRCLPILLLLASGCIKLEQTLTLKPDGQGVLDVDYSIAEQAVSQMKAMETLRAQMAAVSGMETSASHPAWFSAFLDPKEEVIRQMLKPYEAFGMTLQSLSIDLRNGRHHVVMKLPFTSLERLAQTDFFGESGVTLIKNGQGDYVLERVRRSPDQATVVNLGDAGTVKLLSPMLGGFSVTFRVNTPGRIIKTNATKKSLYAAVWTFDFDEDPRAFEIVQNPYIAVIFEGKDVTLPAIQP